MLKQSKIFVLILAVSFLLVLPGIARQDAEDTVTCPVSGKVMKTSEAKVTSEYQGRTYYFCCEKCKEEFLKDPEKYSQKKAETKEVFVCCMHPEVKSDNPGKCPKCGMNLERKAVVRCSHGLKTAGEMACGSMEGCLMMKDAEMKVENAEAGVVITLTSKNPAMVKKIQEHAAKMKECCEKMKKELPAREKEK